MTTRLIVLLAGVVFALASFGLAQSTQPATESAKSLDLASVYFDWSEPDWKPKFEGTPPLFVVGGRKPAGNTCRGDYQCALSGRSFNGTRHILGYLGGPFPEGSAIVAESFTLQAQQIRLVLSYDGTPDAAPKRKGNLCFFVATLDDSLADGVYEITIELKNLPADLKVPAVQQLQVQKPDPRITQALNEFKLFKTLSPKDLFDRYRAQAAPMKGMGAPHEARFIGSTPLDTADEDSKRLATLKREIISRGTAIGPFLIEALREQAVRNPDLSAINSAPPLGMARELMDMLARIGDARAGPVLLDILSGELRCNDFVVDAAVENTEKLTLVRFRKNGPDADAVLGANAAMEPYEAGARRTYRRALAAQYATWISEHPANGADAKPWATEAVRMARTWLEGEDLSEAYSAAAFLRSGAYQPRVVDEDPARTTDRIAAILEQCEVSSSEKTEWGAYYTYRYKPTGQTLPVTIGNWTELLTRGFSVPPRHAALLIRLDREMSDYPGAMAHHLLRVGGNEAMAYRIQVYRRLLSDVNKLGIDPRTDISNMKDRAHQPLVWNCQLYRWGIERWAGRTFADDAELESWWSAEKDRTQQQWLEAGLPLTAAKADAGDRQSQYLMRLVLGTALPNAPQHLVWMQPGHSSDPPPRAEDVEPFRVKWLAEHNDRLQCDVDKGEFVLN
jgi:hypothetical protein